METSAGYSVTYRKIEIINDGWIRYSYQMLPSQGGVGHDFEEGHWVNFKTRTFIIKGANLDTAGQNLHLWTISGSCNGTGKGGEDMPL